VREQVEKLPDPERKTIKKFHFKEIIDMSQGIATSTSLARMTESDMLGLSAAVTALSIESQAGSTSG